MKTVSLVEKVVLITVLILGITSGTLGQDADLIFSGQRNGDAHWPSTVIDIDADGCDDLIVGAPGWSRDKGRVYIYYGGFATDTIADVIIDGEPKTQGRFGNVLGSGDINKDGFGDLVIGAWQYDNRRGRVYLFYGGNPMDTVPDLIFEGKESGSDFSGSWSDIIVSDINGDGCDDIFINSPNDESTGVGYLYYGGSDIDNTADVLPRPEDSTSVFGIGMACGDINNDGYQDILAGVAYERSLNQDYDGRVYAYYGGPGMTGDPDLIFKSPISDGSFGANIGVGDIDGDGKDDIAIGAYSSGNNRGSVYLYFGNGINMNNPSPDIVITGEQDNSYFGDLTTCGGDFNSDGCDELLIGARLYDNWRGRAYLYYGDTAENIVSDPQVVIFTGENSGDWMGDPPGGNFGDFNGDGVDDLTISARMWPKGRQAGRVYLYFGGSSSGGGTPEVQSIGFSTKNAGPNIFLYITVTVVDDSGPVEGVWVEMILEYETGSTWDFYGSTDTNGEIKFTLKNAQSGYYTATITNLDGYTTYSDFIQ